MFPLRRGLTLFSSVALFIVYVVSSHFCHMSCFSLLLSLVLLYDFSALSRLCFVIFLSFYCGDFFFFSFVVFFFNYSVTTGNYTHPLLHAFPILPSRG